MISLPEWFPPAYRQEAEEAIAIGMLTEQDVLEGCVLPQDDFLFDPWFGQTAWLLQEY